MSNALKISEACSLAIHAMTLMAQEPHTHATTHGLARVLDASEAHLSKVMQRLVKAELVRSVRGPKGGFELARPPDQIRLMDIYEVIEGPFSATFCLLKKPVCRGEHCVLGDLVRSINEQFRRYLSQTTLADLRNVGAAVLTGKNHESEPRPQYTPPP